MLKTSFRDWPYNWPEVSSIDVKIYRLPTLRPAFRCKFTHIFLITKYFLGKIRFLTKKNDCNTALSLFSYVKKRFLLVKQTKQTPYCYYTIWRRYRMGCRGVDNEEVSFNPHDSFSLIGIGHRIPGGLGAVVVLEDGILIGLVIVVLGGKGKVHVADRAVYHLTGYDEETVLPGRTDAEL